MLIVERNENGRTVVRLHKDWHIGRLSSAYSPPRKNYVIGESAELLQKALLKTSQAKAKAAARARRLAFPEMER